MLEVNIGLSVQGFRDRRGATFRARFFNSAWRFQGSRERRRASLQRGGFDVELSAVETPISILRLGWVVLQWFRGVLVTPLGSSDGITWFPSGPFSFRWALGRGQRREPRACSPLGACTG